MRQVLFWSRVPNLASTVRAIRQRLKQTMAEFAEMIGTEQSTISRYEAGQIVPSKTVLILLLLLATDSEKRPILEALGIVDEQQIEAQFRGAEEALKKVSELRRRHGRDPTLVQFAGEAAQIVSAGAPVGKALVQIMKLWRLQRDSQELQQSLEQMLPYFRFVAGQHGKPEVE
jgi:transcriptional regulator with XRE-family HTH domain